MDGPFFQSVLNSLEEQLALIDKEGTIFFVNESWKKFGLDNGFSPDQDWVGVNYIHVCEAAGLDGDTDAVSVVEGINSVLSGERRFFEYEYPCHSPEEKRWFILRATHVRDIPEEAFVLTHQNITRRKSAEEAVIYASLHDPLTNLANRRHFDSFLSDEWRRCLRDKASLCILMIDLDHFKKFNDEKGHLAGDELLQFIAGIIRSHATRPTDLSARFGGDEFSVVLGDTPLEGGLMMARGIMGDIRDLGRKSTSGEMFTASIGVASVVPGTNDCPDEKALVGLADMALYNAKSGGRNRIEVK